MHPLALELLVDLKIATENLRSKSWDEFTTPDAPHLDFVFTVCDKAAAEQCPYWPGQPMTAHWGIPDPAAIQGTEQQQRKAFREALICLGRRIELFVNLPIESLGRMALQRELDCIARESPTEAEA